jgi:polysaccharide chain length determinant protein (PEP-CTERM system associated)
VVPGKKYKPEDFLEIAWRRRWLILAPMVLVGVGTFIWVQTLPDRYRSTAVVLVMPPQVPMNYIRPTVTEPLDRRLQTMQQELLSSARLKALVEEFDLYPDLRREQLLDEVVAQMRRDISVVPARARRREGPGSFDVSFQYGNPRTAMLVADRIAALFVQRNLEARAVQADSTTQFLDSQLAIARQRLEDHEKKLEAFRRANAGRLPTEAGSNLEVLKASQEQLQATTLSINQDRDRQITLERMISDELAAAAAGDPALPAAPGSRRGDATATTAAAQLAAAQAQLAALTMRLKDDHPDVRSLKRRINELEKAAADEALQQPVSNALVSINPADAARQKRIATLRADFDGLERRMAAKREQVAQLQKTIEDYRARLNAAPTLESELTQLMRDYTTLDQAYSSLLLKSQDARLAANLEERQVGEVFKIVESARMPPRPTSPDRVRMNLIGTLAGLGFGLALAGLLEYKDRSLRTEDDVVLTLALPVLALVPTMVTTAERRRRKKHRVLLVSSGAVAVLVLLAVAAWRFQVLSTWMR